jgi:hypothetical protein
VLWITSRFCGVGLLRRDDDTPLGKRKFQGQRQGREIGAETLRGRSQRLPRRQEARQLRAFVFCSGNLRERRTAWWGSEDSNYPQARSIGALVVVNLRRQVRAPDDCDELLRLIATSLWTGTARPFRVLPLANLLASATGQRGF